MPILEVDEPDRVLAFVPSGRLVTIRENKADAQAEKQLEYQVRDFPAQKGPTCWYYSLKILRGVFEFFQRKKIPRSPVQEVIHTFRKQFTAYYNKLEFIDFLKTIPDPPGISIDKLQSLAPPIFMEYIASLEKVTATLAPKFLETFRSVSSSPENIAWVKAHFHEPKETLDFSGKNGIYMEAIEKLLRLRVYVPLLLAIPEGGVISNPPEILHYLKGRFAALKPIIGFAQGIFRHYLIYEEGQYDVFPKERAIESINAKNGVNQLIRLIQDRGPFEVTGHMGKPYYSIPPVPLAIPQVRSRKLYGWTDPKLYKIENPNITHSIVIIGVVKHPEDNDKSYVLYLDPNDDSGIRKQRIAYVMSFKSFKTRLNSGLTFLQRYDIPASVIDSHIAAAS